MITNPAPGLGQSCRSHNKGSPSIGNPVGGRVRVPGNDDHLDGCVDVVMCPVTCQPCTTEQYEFCEDYGCARLYGYDVDGEASL